MTIAQRLSASLLAVSLLTMPGIAAAEATAALGAAAPYDHLLPLEGSSNFRDLGGYRTADGHTVKRGLLFRSGSMVSLTPADMAALDKLGIRNVVDLRSNEERELYPNHWVQASELDYVTRDYRLMDLLGGSERPESFSMATMYQGMVIGLKPQLQQYFAEVLEGDGGVVVNCSAGQDRTGITSALLLSALGVSRETVMVDYLLSTQFRDAANEQGTVDLAAAAKTNAFARLMLRYGDGKAHSQPQPLVTADGTPFLAFALDRIERDYGSVENYLSREIGIGPEQIGLLKRRYLE